MGISHKGMKHSEESKAKLSKHFSGKPLIKNDAWKKKITEALKSRNVTDKMREVSRRNGLARRGTKLSQEAVEKIRASSTGRKHSDETKKKIGEANRRRVYTDEMRKKMSENSNKLWSDPVKGKKRREELAAMAKKLKPTLGRKATEEQRKANSERVKKWWAEHPEMKEVIAASNQKRAKAKK